MKKINVMVVDDAVMMRMVIRTILEKDPNIAVVASCENGKVALDQLKTAKPDVIVLDLEMPQMDGLTFLRHARLQSRARVVVLSSVVGEGSEKALMAKRLGADAVVAKPSGSVSFDLEQKRGAQLISTVRTLAH